MQEQYNKMENDCQVDSNIILYGIKTEKNFNDEVKDDINDIKNKFLPSKIATLKLENIYNYLNLKYSWLNFSSKSYNLRNCGSYLEFVLENGQNIAKKKLSKAITCKGRFCPFCTWRKSLRVFSNIRKIYDEIERQEKNINNNDKSRFLFLTLTTKNVTGAELSNEITNLVKSFKRFTELKKFKNAFLGFVRSIEVVRDREPIITKEMYNRKKEYYDKNGLTEGESNPNYLMFNCHIHILLHTTYAIYQKNYISQEELTEMWQKSAKLDYIPIVDIRSFKAKNIETKGREIAEIAKYSVKPTDYLRYDYKINEVSLDDLKKEKEFELDCETIYYLETALSGRRLFGLGGTFKELHKKLNLDDDKLTDTDIELAENSIVLKYFYDFYENKYKKIDNITLGF